MADNAYTYHNGTILPLAHGSSNGSGTSGAELCLKISKTSKKSKKEIEQLIAEQLAKSTLEENNSGTEESRQTAPDSPQPPMETILKKDTPSEYIFSFKYETNHQKRCVARMLDSIHEKVSSQGHGQRASAPIVINSISCNSLMVSLG